MRLRNPMVMHEFRGRLATRVFVLLAAACLAGAASLPEVDLVDASGVKVGRAALRVAGDKCQVRLTMGKMPPGRYRPVLTKGRKCFSSGAGAAGAQVVAEGGLFVVEANGAFNSEIVFSSVNDSDNLEEIIAHSGLMLQALPEQTPEKSKPAAACGQVSRWFSPWRDFRRSGNR